MQKQAAEVFAAQQEPGSSRHARGAETWHLGNFGIMR
jgi:hypothetical protein